MNLVIVYWSILLVVILVQIFTIVYCVRNEKVIACEEEYSPEVSEKARKVIHCIRTGIIKKHIITNSAKRYDSRTTLKRYRSFLNSKLMNDILSMDEESYNG